MKSHQTLIKDFANKLPYKLKRSWPFWLIVNPDNTVVHFYFYKAEAEKIQALLNANRLTGYVQGLNDALGSFVSDN